MTVAARVQQFIERMTAAAGTVTQVATRDAIMDAVIDYREALGLQGPVAAAPALADLAWPAHWPMTIGAAADGHELGVAQADLGIAETGSLLMASSPQSPNTLHYLPEYEVVCLNAERIVATLAAALGRFNADNMPRALNLLTGPSRTADVEQTMQLGAHGPRALHVIIDASCGPSRSVAATS